MNVQSGMFQYIQALLAGEPCAHVIVDTLPPAEIEAIAAFPDITWRVLSRQPDRDAAIRLLEYRFQDALMRGAPEVVVLDLASPELAGDAAVEPELEELALRAMTALVWDECRAAVLVYQRFCSLRSDEAMEGVYEICREALCMAPLWQRVASECAIPGPLGRLVRLRWVASPALIGELITNLRSDIIARSSAYLDAFDAMAVYCPSLLMYLVSLAERFVPDNPSLGELDEDERAKLGATLGQIDAPMAHRLRFSHRLAGAAAAGALLSLAGFGTVAVATIMGLSAAALGYAVWRERGMYGRAVRRPLAAYLAEVGTPTNCVVSWLLLNRKTVKKIKAFDVAINTDAALAVIARLGRMTRLHDPIHHELAASNKI